MNMSLLKTGAIVGALLVFAFAGIAMTNAGATQSSEPGCVCCDCGPVCDCVQCTCCDCEVCDCETCDCADCDSEDCQCSDCDCSIGGACDCCENSCETSCENSTVETSAEKSFCGSKCGCDS